MLNLLSVQPGQYIRMKDGTLVEVVSNVGDGMWLNGRFPNGEEEMVFCEDIASLEESPQVG